MRITALGCCCRRMRAFIILQAMRMRLIFRPPEVEPAQAQTSDPKISSTTASGVHRLVSAVAKPVVETSDTNWNEA